MALVTVDGIAAFRGRIGLPRVGVWIAELELDTTDALAGAVEVQIATGPTLRGTVVRGDTYAGQLHTRIVGGAAGMTKLATPKHYNGPVISTVLTDLARTAGEKVSGSIARATAGRALQAWTVLGTSIGEQLAVLITRGLPAGHAWRILPDGSLWVGLESWPEADLDDDDWTELARHARERRLDLGLSAPRLLPGTTLGPDRIDYVDHRFGPDGVRATAWLA